MDPLAFGDYPFSMRTLVGDRLPKFTHEESEMLENSYDFIGINYYTAYFAKDVVAPEKGGCYHTDSRADLAASKFNSNSYKFLLFYVFFISIILSQIIILFIFLFTGNIEGFHVGPPVCFNNLII